MFANRREAGRLLAKELQSFKANSSLILAIPRGGVVVGDEIAQKMDVHLDVIVSKKVTPPDYPEYAIGAIMHDGTVYWNIPWQNFLTSQDRDEEIEKKKKEVQRRLEKFRGSSRYELDGKVVIMVDDGIATGSTVFVILEWLSKQNPKKIVVAVPVIAAQTYEAIKKVAGNVVALEIPYDFSAVGQFYEEFEQVTDEEVLSILGKYK